MRIVSLRSVFVGLSVFVLTACGSLSMFELDASPREARAFAQHGNLPEEVGRIANPLVEQGYNVGLAVAVHLPDGSEHFFGYGSRGAPGSPPPDAETLFAIGSLSKGFVAAAAALMVDEGRVSWSDALVSHLPSHLPLSADTRKISLLQLAMHNSGLPRQPYEFPMFKNLLRYSMTGQNLYEHIDRDYTFRYLGEYSAPRQIQPQYSNIGYGLLGYVLEQKAGIPLEQLVAQRVLAPLQLTHTGYQPQALPGYAQRALGHAGDQPKFMQRGDPVADWQFNDFLRSTAGMYSTPADLLRFAVAHFECQQKPFNRVLAGNLVPRMARPVDAPAIQWVVDDVDGQHITHQVGLVSGYSGYIGLDAERRMAVVVLQNNFNWTDKIGHKLLHRLAAYYDAHPEQMQIRQPVQCPATDTAGTTGRSASS